MVSTDDAHPREDEVLWEITAAHLDEAEFMLEIWEAALDSPDYTLAELAEGPERRLLAHVDALQIGGPVVAERLLLPTIERAGAWPERVTAAALAHADVDRLVRALVETDDDEHRRGLARGLELLDVEGLDAKLIAALDASGTGTAALLDLLARRGAAVGDQLATYLRSDDPAVATAAARLARGCSDRGVLEQLGALAQADDAGLRRAAVETALVRRVEGAWASALYWAFTPGDSPFRRDALLWVALLGDAGVHRRLLEQLDRAEPREDVVWALGSCGRIAAVDRCVELLADAELGPLAGEVVCAIAGLARDEDRFWRPRPPADGEGQTLPAISAAELARDLVPTAEDALPQPRADVIASWWHERRAELDPALRHLGGRVLDRGVLVDALWREPLRRRHAHALELSLRTAGGLWLPTRALSWAQREALDGLGELDGVELQRGWGLR